MEIAGAAMPKKFVVSQKPRKPEDPLPQVEYEIFQKKIEYCSHPLGLAKKMLINLKERKKYLSEILEPLMEEESTEDLILPNLDMLLLLVEANLFRPLSKLVFEKPISETMTKSVSEPGTDPDWPQLLPVYRIFKKLIESPVVDNQKLESWLRGSRTCRLVGLLESENEPEREYVFLILNQLMLKIPGLRSPIKACVRDIFEYTIHEGLHHNGIKEALLMYSGVVQGFKTPLKSEHVEVFDKTILSLFKVPTSQLFYAEIIQLVGAFLAKEEGLLPLLLDRLCGFWPKTNSFKQALFLQTFGSVLTPANSEVIPQHTAESVLRRVAEALASQNIKVCDVAVNLFECAGFFKIFDRHKEKGYSLVLPPAQAQAAGFWQESFRECFFALLQHLEKVDEQLFIRVCGAARMKKAADEQLRALHEDVWQQLEYRARKALPGLPKVVVPHSADYLLSSTDLVFDNNSLPLELL